MSSLLKKLEDNRIPILLAEIGAYIHLIGRFSKEFILAQAKNNTQTGSNFDYQQICNSSNFFEDKSLGNLLKDDNWENLLNGFKNLTNPGELDTNKITNLCEFIEKHTWNDKPKGLCKILADAHGIVSGIDKALAGKGGSGKQSSQYTYRATAFGYEKEIELLGSANLNNVDENQISNTKREFFQKLNDILYNILKNQNISYDNYKEFVNLIKQYYPKTIAETRRPINEISLYDYAHTIASLVKSNLAKMVIDKWYEPRGNSKWRILKINLNVIELLSKGLKIGDIFGYKAEIEDTYEAIKKIIEFDYPLGNEIYRDSTGIYFSCPNIENINELKSEIIEKLKHLNKLDFNLQIDISGESRSMVILANEREESLKRIVYPHTGDVENLVKEFKESQDAGGEDICPVCRIKLKPVKDERCQKCKDRYQKRVAHWINTSQKTIWLDEVSDHNDRVALIIGFFDLRKWLSGEFLDTFVSQTFYEWKNENQSLCSKLEINDISDLKKGFEELLNGSINLDENWKNICKSFTGRSPNNFMNDFWMPIAERDATGKALSLKNNSENAKHLIKLLFRKHPSLARIYRIWQTTQDFIHYTVLEDILNNHPYGTDSPFIDLRKKRIKFTIQLNTNIPKGTTCDIDIDGVRFSPVCIDETNKLFLTTINLQILANKGKTINEIVSWMSGKKIKIKSETDNKWKDESKISNAEPANDEFQNYLPYVKIYDYPDQFMALVPAYDAFDIAKKILEEYEIQFSKVRDRLPFHIGIIAFHRKTPLYIAMDAGKRLIETFKEKTKTISARVNSINNTDHNRLGKYVKELTLNPNPCYFPVPLAWKISYSTGDPNQEDEWHPYIRFNGNNLKERNYSFDYTGNGDYVVHVKELKQNDCIRIETSYFKMSYLESASERFQIGDNLRPLDDIKRIDSIWEDIQRILKSKGLGISQLYAFWQEVKKRYEDYRGDSVWEDFVRSCLTNILKISPQNEKNLFDELFEATKDGALDLCLHWNLQVRKIKPKTEGV